MKINCFYLCIAISIAFASSKNVTAQSADTLIAKKGLCHTWKRQGIEIYILTEPVNLYEVTGTVSSGDAILIMNAINGTADERTITKKIDALIDNAKRKAKKGKFSFDAIITEDGDTGTCIKFL